MRNSGQPCMKPTQVWPEIHVHTPWHPRHELNMTVATRDLENFCALTVSMSLLALKNLR